MLLNLPIHEDQSSGEPSNFQRSNLGSERSSGDVMLVEADKWRHTHQVDLSKHLEGVLESQALDPILGVVLMMFLVNWVLVTASLGTVQPLQGEFCETGVLICFKSNGCSRAPPRGVLCSWCTNLFRVRQGLIGYSPAPPRGVLFGWCSYLIWVRWELVTCHRSGNWVGYCCNCSRMSKRNFGCGTICSWHRG